MSSSTADKLLNAALYPDNPRSKSYWNWLRHFEGMNMLFADGSVGWRRREDCRRGQACWEDW